MTTTNKRRNLVLFTNYYPFARGESFLENEIPEIAPLFEKVIIISASKDDCQTRALPQNCQLFRQPLTKSIGLRGRLFLQRLSTLAALFLQEVANCKSWRALLTMLLQGEERLFWARGPLAALAPEETTLYSYWMDNGAYVVASLHQENPAYRTICRAHGCDLFSERAPGNYLPLRPFLLQNMDKVALVAAYSRNYLQQKYPWADNIILSHLGTRPPPVSGLLLKEGNRPCELLSVSNLIPLKRVEKIILGLARCTTAWHWTHIGDGPQRQELEELAARLLADKTAVSFTFAGAMDNSALYDYYSRQGATAFITTTSSEGGLPVSIMEAFSFGLPVVATGVCGLPELVDEQVGYLLAADPTPEEVAAVLDKIAALAPAEYEKLSAAARERWAAEYNSQCCYQKFGEILLGISDGK